MNNGADEWSSGPELRRDSAPHRGQLLLVLAWISAVASITSVFGLPALLAVGLGVSVYFMARHDRKRIEEGQVDPQGLSLTDRAQRLAVAAIAISILLGTLPCLFFSFMIVIILFGK
jgi:hypothetical protein